MSDAGTGEKTEEPTHERLRKLRADGNVPKSQDVISAVSYNGLFCLLAATMGLLSDELRAILNGSIQMAFYQGEALEIIAMRSLHAGLWSMARASAPICLAGMVIGTTMHIAQVGFMFTTKPLTPDLNKLNPVNGLKNLVSMKKVIDLLKTVIKFVVVAWISYSVLSNSARDLALTIRTDLGAMLQVVGQIFWECNIKIGGAFLLIAALDFLYTRYQFTKDNMMSKYDVKQEYKQSEGDPQQKADRKRFHQEIINSGGASAVKGASAVVRNPDHIAVAIKYDKEKGGAPVVLAKGQRIWAEKILEAARHYGIPVVRNVPLAQALNKLDVGDEIPEELYEAVAEVLNFIYTLSQEQEKKGPKGAKTKALPAAGAAEAAPKVPEKRARISAASKLGPRGSGPPPRKPR